MAEVTTILCPNCHKPNLRRARFCQHCGHDAVLNNSGPCYYITRIIKEGGQGAVYETIGDDGRVYAVKEMLDRFTDPKERTEAIQRFAAEARMLQQLSHPRIPRVYSFFQDEGRHYLAMDFVTGEDLEEILRRDGPIPEPQALEWVDQICDVLDHLHGNGLIYRDMKPSNVMIDHKIGGVKLVDFGIAKVFQRVERGTQIGTPGYAPPEQYQGIATPQSDIYALGATLHHMLTGRDPRDELPFSFPLAHEVNPSISRRTSDAIQRAVQKDARDRYQSVSEFRAALRHQPAPPPQVRIAKPTTVLQPQPQPQVAVPATATPTAAPRPAPAAPTPTSAATATQQRRPAPAAAQQQRSAATAQQSPPRRGFGFVRWLAGIILVLALAAGTLALALPDVVAGYIPNLLSAPQPTAQTFIQETFAIENLVVVVPPGRDVREAFIEAFTFKAREQRGAGTIINPNAPPTFLGGVPEKIGDDPRGTIYRASMQGFIRVPKP